MPQAKVSSPVAAPMKPQITLASTSPYRSDLLKRLGLAFSVASPDIDERARPGETPAVLVTRLALEKARAVANRKNDGLVIGSDQVASIEGRILGKPGLRDRAIAQLRAISGNAVTFYTGLSLLNVGAGRAQTCCETYVVHFRRLSDQKIERYLDAERPFDCAGSFRSEGLGICLFTRLEGDDPNSLIGLPLIRLIDMLEREGVPVP